MAVVVDPTEAQAEVFVMEAGKAWVRFVALGNLSERLNGRDVVELVGKAMCAYCDAGPFTVSAPAGEWTYGLCPYCRGEHMYQAVEPVGEVA